MPPLGIVATPHLSVNCYIELYGFFLNVLVRLGLKFFSFSHMPKNMTVGIITSIKGVTMCVHGDPLEVYSHLTQVVMENVNGE